MNDRTKDYVFLSYSHKDNVDGLLQAFDKHGYNIVYDKAMSYGEEWDLNARRYISSEKCKGVVFVMSEHSLTSKAILTEAEYTSRFNKKYFSVLLSDMTLLELRHAIYDMLDENKKYIIDSILESFSGEQLYAKATDMQWDKIGEVFEAWGFQSCDTGDDNLTQVRYTTDMKGEKVRLNNQQRGYYSFDKRALDIVLGYFDRDGLCVLDIGCANGALTISRFADEERISKVIGVDYNASDIAEARKAAEDYNGKFAFYTLDLESADVLEQLNDLLMKEGVGKADIVFGALVLHHLKNPSKLLLRLYDVMREDGRIIIRGSDDGSKLCYPKSELLDEILTRYGKLITASDRTNGRKLYTQLYNAGYVEIKMLYSVVDTCGKDRKSRERLFDVGFSFRLNRIDELIAKNPENTHLREEREWLERAIAELREAFVDRSFWYCNTSYIAIAGVTE